MARIAIIGAGLSGLCAAWELKRQRHAVTVYEASNDVGGAARSIREDGWLVEAGPNTLQLNSHEIAELLGELDLSPVEAPASAAKRFIVRSGQLRALPRSLPEFFTTKWLSVRGKLRLLQEPFISARRQPPGPYDLPLPPGYEHRLPQDVRAEESLAQMVERRLGRELLDYAINPFVAGIYAGDPEQLSVRYGFPRLFRLEQAYGSFLRGALIRMTSPKHRDPDQVKARLISFPEGLQKVPEALAEAIGRDSIHTNHPVTSVTRSESRWTINRTDAVDTVIVATPAFALGQIEGPEEILEPISLIARVPHAAVASVALGFRREAIRHPLDGFGFLVPEVEQVPILGCLFSSTLFPNRAPEGHVLLTSFVGGAREPDAASLSDNALVRRVTTALRPLLGLSSEPMYSHITRWPRAIPQIGLPHDRILRACDEIEHRCPGLYVTGNYRGGIALTQVIKSGLATGRRAAAALAGQPSAKLHES